MEDSKMEQWARSGRAMAEAADEWGEGLLGNVTVTPVSSTGVRLRIKGQPGVLCMWSQGRLETQEEM